MKKVKNWLNFSQFDKDLEENSQPSITLPDQSMTIKQMLERHSKGLPIALYGGEAIYGGEEDELPDLRKMDLSEIQDLREFIQGKINQAHQEAVALKKKKEDQEKAEFAEYRRHKEAQRQAEEQKLNQPTVQPNSPA